MPARIGKLLLCFCDEVTGGLETFIAFKSHAVAIGDEASGLDQARRFQCVRAHEKARAQNETIGNAVGLVCDHAPYFDIEGADPDPVSQL